MYARALFVAAKDRGRLTEVRDGLADFVGAMDEVPQLGALVRDPELDRQAKAAALAAVLGDADELVRNFVLLVVEKGRATELTEILRELDELVAREEGRLKLELTTAFALDEQEAGRIVEEIERASGRTIEATRRVDPSLIGGLVLQIGSLRVDASVRGRLERLRRDLATATA
jgi:F-type H+-transporting ATPase subunit delta